MERPGSASPDACAVPPPPAPGDLFNFVRGALPPAGPAVPGAALPLREPEWERARPFLSGEFLLQARLCKRHGIVRRSSLESETAADDQQGPNLGAS